MTGWMAGWLLYKENPRSTQPSASQPLPSKRVSAREAQRGRLRIAS